MCACVKECLDFKSLEIIFEILFKGFVIFFLFLENRNWRKSEKYLRNKKKIVWEENKRDQKDVSKEKGK